MKKILISLIALLILSAVPASAQTYPKSTTLSASITAQAKVITLGSGTGVEKNGALWIDVEFIPIQSCANSTCTIVNVMRPNKPQAHGKGTVVTAVTAAARPNVMRAALPPLVGQCSTSTSMVPATALANIQYLPLFDIDTGYVYDCRRNGPGAAGAGTWVWNGTFAQNINGTSGSVPTAWP